MPERSAGVSRRLLLRGGRIVGPDAVIAHGWLTVAEGRIEAAGAGEPEPALAEHREVVELAGATVLPGFIDVHVHGAVGHEVMDGTVTGLADMSAFFATRGVTSFLATTWTAGRWPRRPPRHCPARSCWARTWRGRT
jgi:N-acetylglucosamine-6-phosphate deacetylase